MDGARSDLEGLTAFDTNGNGLLDAGDEAFDSFRIWVDNDANGKSDPGELMTLTEAGIESLSLTGALSGDKVEGNIVIRTPEFTRTDGTKGTAYDVALELAPVGGGVQTQVYSLQPLDAGLGFQPLTLMDLLDGIRLGDDGLFLFDELATGFPVSETGLAEIIRANDPASGEVQNLVQNIVSFNASDAGEINLTDWEEFNIGKFVSFAAGHPELRHVA